MLNAVMSDFMVILLEHFRLTDMSWLILHEVSHGDFVAIGSRRQFNL